MNKNSKQSKTISSPSTMTGLKPIKRSQLGRSAGRWNSPTSSQTQLLQTCKQLQNVMDGLLVLLNTLEKLQADESPMQTFRWLRPLPSKISMKENFDQWLAAYLDAAHSTPKSPRVSPSTKRKIRGGATAAPRAGP